MPTTRISIEELADAAGLTRRAVRFYVQQRLLPVPYGVGRGKHYDKVHLDRLTQVRDLQAAGHSLDQIRQMLEPQAYREAPATFPIPAPKPSAPVPLRAELWRRLRIAEGVELNFDAARFNPTVEDLLKLRDAIAGTFTPDNANQKEKETP